MYPQIRVKPKTAAYQKVLWQPSKNMPLDEYPLNSVTFGTASAAYLTTRALASIREYLSSPKEVKNAIRNSFYVDDMLTGSNTINNTIALMNWVIQTLSKFNMVICKITSNDETVRNSIPHDKKIHFSSDDDDPQFKTFGIKWHVKQIYLHFKHLRYPPSFPKIRVKFASLPV
jgi:hypothetical protein